MTRSHRPMRARTRSLTEMIALAATLTWPAAAGAAEPPPVPETDKSDYMLV